MFDGTVTESIEWADGVGWVVCILCHRALMGECYGIKYRIHTSIKYRVLADGKVDSSVSGNQQVHVSNSEELRQNNTY